MSWRTITLHALAISSLAGDGGNLASIAADGTIVDSGFAASDLATSSAISTAISSAVSSHASATSGVHGISSFGATLVDDANAAEARSTLGLGTAATTAASAYATAAQGAKADTAVQPAALSAYLQLTGGTLTGGLSGTTASFSGKISTTSTATDSLETLGGVTAAGVITSSALKIGNNGVYGALYIGTLGTDSLISIGSAGVGDNSIYYDSAGHNWRSASASTLMTLVDLQLNVLNGVTAIFGTDPGGSEPFRVGGAGRFSGVLTLQNPSGATAATSAQLNVSSYSASSGSHSSISFRGRQVESAINYDTTIETIHSSPGFSYQGWAGLGVGLYANHPINVLADSSNPIKLITGGSVRLEAFASGIKIGGQLWLGNTYQVGAPTPTGYLILYDAAGNPHEVPARPV